MVDIQEKIELCRKLVLEGILSFDESWSTENLLFFDVKGYKDTIFLKIDVSKNTVKVFCGSYYMAVEEFLNLLPYNIRKHFLFNLDLFT